MTKMTSRERLMRVFAQQETDRMPIRIWGVDPMFPSGRKSWKYLYELTEKYELDIIRDWSPVPKKEKKDRGYEIINETRDSEKPDMYEDKNIIKTPKGDLTQIHYRPKDGKPGYVKKHLVESVQDAQKWLSLPSEDDLPEVESYAEFARKSGDRAMIMVGLSQAMYCVQALMGSEIFGFWLVEERPLLHEMIDKCYKDVERLAKHYLHHGIADCYGWVGPELCIPPLASPRDFKEFVYDYDKKIIDLVRNENKFTWIHCHGDMHPVLEGFVDMGLDCLNPIEPPPAGNLTLAEAKKRVAGRMTLDGGVEDGDFDMLEPDEMREKVEETVRMGKPGGCFILSPTSSPTTWPELNERHLENYRIFVETGMENAGY